MVIFQCLPDGYNKSQQRWNKHKKTRQPIYRERQHERNPFQRFHSLSPPPPELSRHQLASRRIAWQNVTFCDASPFNATGIEDKDSGATAAPTTLRRLERST
jgi:hypothetical protein